MTAPIRLDPLLPPFDQYGNLDAGAQVAGAPSRPIQHCSLAELRSRFVDEMPDSTSRLEIWDGWMSHREAIEAFSIDYATLVNGSFTTTRLNPVDIDVCYVLDAVAVSALARPANQELDRLFNGLECKSRYRCDPYYIPWYPMTHLRFQSSLQKIAYWTRVFGTDRNGRLKCIPMLSERGTV